MKNSQFFKKLKAFSLVTLMLCFIICAFALEIFAAAPASETKLELLEDHYNSIALPNADKYSLKGLDGIHKAYLSAKESISSLVNENEINAAFEAGITAINNAHDIAFCEMFEIRYRDILNKANPEIDDLGTIDSALTQIKEHTARDSALIDGFRSSLLSSKKIVLAKYLESKKDGSNNVIIDANIEKINNIQVNGNTAADNAANELLDKTLKETDNSINDIKFRIKFETERDKYKQMLRDVISALSLSEKYSEAGITALNSKLETALAELDAIDASVSESFAAIEEVYNKHISLFYEEKTSYLFSDDKNCFITSSKGMSSSLILGYSPNITPVTQVRNALIKEHSFAVLTGNMTQGEAYKTLKNRRTVLQFDIAAYDIKSGIRISGADNGEYTVRIKLPEEYRSNKLNLQVVILRDNVIGVCDTKVDGDYLEFRTTCLTKFTVLGDKKVDASWVAILLGIVFIGEVVANLLFRHNRKKKNENLYSFAPIFPIAAIMFTPVGIIPIIIILAVLSVGGGVVLSKQILDAKREDAEAKAQAIDLATEDEVYNDEETSEDDIPDDTLLVDVEAPEEAQETSMEGIVSEEVTEEPAQVVEESNATVSEDDDDDDSEEMFATELEGDTDEDTIVERTVFTDHGFKVYVTYDYSFESKLALSSEDTKRRYSVLSELLMSYNLNARRSWKKERYYSKGKTYVQMIFRGKTLCLCMAILPESLEGSKYSYENVGNIKKYENVPVMVRIRSSRGCKYACELISMMMEGAGISQKYLPEDTYSESSLRTREDLVAEGLIKRMMTDGHGDIVPADFEAMKNHKFSPETEMPLLSKVTAEVASHIPDEAAVEFIETELEVDEEISYGTRKGIINIDTISDAFENGDVVTLDALKAKHLVPKNIHFVKVLARGTLDKSITVKAHDFSMDAVKMIVMADGNVVKLKFVRKQ